MSADSWAVCPRCFARAAADAHAEYEQLMDLYGQVPAEEFDRKRAALKPVNRDDFQTFREDYAFYGAETGEVTASYFGICSQCGLSTELRASKRFWMAPVSEGREAR